MNLPGEKRHLAFKALPHELFNKGGKVYGYAVMSGDACQLSDEHCTVLSHIPSGYILLEDIRQCTAAVVESTELLDILKDLSDTGFIKPFDKHSRPISSINIFLSTYCNLNCAYCYGGAGRSDNMPGGSYGMEQEQLSYEMGRKAVDYLLKTSGIRQGGSAGGINFFGGEPLMNMEVLKDIAEYAEEQARKYGTPIPSFSITTNGLLVDETFINLCKQHHIGVQISFDGTPDAQNTMRPTTSGQASYPALEKAIRLIRENGIRIRIRATVSNRNLALIESIQHLESLDVYDVHFAVASGHDLDRFALTDKDFETLESAFDDVGSYTVERVRAGKPFVRCNNLLSAMAQLHGQKNKNYACGAGLGLASLSPDGSFHICHRFAGMNNFEIGHIDRGIDYRKRLKLIEQMHSDTHKECRECWAKDLCGGECHYSNYEANQCISVPSRQMCDLHKSILKTAMVMASEIRQHDERMYFRILNNSM